MAGLVPLAPQFLRQIAYALAGPPERGFWVTACRRLYQLFQVLAQGGIMFHRALATPANAADTALLNAAVWASQLPHPLADGPWRRAQRPGHNRLTATSDRHRLSTQQEPSHSLVHKVRNRLIPIPDAFYIDHSLSIS